MKINVEPSITNKITALELIHCINERDLGELEKLLAVEHTFISKINDVQKGKVEMVKSWERFFKLFPDYRIYISLVYSTYTDFVVLIGRADCSNDMLNGPHIWTAYVNNNEISEWRVYEDNETTRNKLHVSDKYLEPQSEQLK